jgi:hypothetical protein
MDVSELMQTVSEEGLDTPVLYGKGALRQDAVVLERTDAGWSVYLVNERGGVVGSTLKTFTSESDALEHVLRKLRHVAKAHRSMAALSD